MYPYDDDMETIIFKVVFLVGVAVALAIRLFYYKVTKKAGLPKRKLNLLDTVIVGISVTGFYILPIIYCLTPWLNSFNYNLPLAISIIFGTSYVFGIFVFYKAHHDLGKYWWMGYELTQHKELVTQGIYAWIRHPMYAGFFLIGLGNIFILQNWIAGFSHLVTLLPLYLLHVPLEERHLKSHFGEAFNHYKRYTGKIFPGRRNAGH